MQFSKPQRKEWHEECMQRPMVGKLGIGFHGIHVCGLPFEAVDLSPAIT
jgi:hypothetical protein